jgi:hypothetical protein
VGEEKTAGKAPVVFFNKLDGLERKLLEAIIYEAFELMLRVFSNQKDILNTRNLRELLDVVVNHRIASHFF